MPVLFAATWVLTLLAQPGPADTVARQQVDAAATARVFAEERARIDLIKQITPAVVCLYPKDSMAGGGSGVLIDPDGYGLTNFHVVAAMLEKREADGGLPDHIKRDVQVLGIDPHGDLAMFRMIRNTPAPFVELGDSDTLQVGDNCLALGNPFLLADDFTPTVTFGIVSGLHRYQWGTGRALNYTDCIQVDTSINPGNSGGPLFDMNGRLVGINGRVSIEERGRVNVGIGYAISINQVKRFIPALRAGLVTPHAAAGFTVIDAPGGVRVNQILPDSAAYRAGLRLDDLLLRFGGVPLEGANHFLSQLGTYPARWPIEIVLKRGGQTSKLAFRLDELPLPEVRRGRRNRNDPGPPAPDPFAPSDATRAANRRAVRRAFELYSGNLGGADAIERTTLIAFTGQRRLVDRPQDPSARLDTIESAKKPEGTEAAIRWEVMRLASASAKARGKVVRSDFVRGRYAVVIERILGDPIEDEATSMSATSQPEEETRPVDSHLRYQVSFDDGDGRLLAIEYDDPGSGKARRYEYDDLRHAGPLRVPHHRWSFVDGHPEFEDTFEKIEVTGS